MIHLYIGDGKGKTTAAIGLVIRSLAYDKKALLVNFLKDGNSGEIKWLKNNSDVELMYQENLHGFLKDLNSTEFTKAKELQLEMLKVLLNIKKEYQLIVLDEFTDIIALDVININEAVKVIQELSEGAEVVITGHQMYPELIDLADYYTEFISRKHPYKKGIKARRGIEY